MNFRPFRRAAYGCLAVVGVGFLAGCSQSEKPVTFHAEGNPAQLSDWAVLKIADGHLLPAKTVFAYDLATPLFSDYAGKLRTVWLPNGMRAKYTADGTFDFPVGTIVSKTFFYMKNGTSVARGDTYLKTTHAPDLDLFKVRLVETRLMVKRATGWTAFPYVWNEAQTEATLQRSGAEKEFVLDGISVKPISFTYAVPNVNQCAGCHATNHTTKELQPIGLQAMHLNHPAFADADVSQLKKMAQNGLLTGVPANAPSAAVWTDTSLSLDARARSYLEINCAHCHNQNGAADTSGLWLTAMTQDPAKWGICKTPIAAGQGSGNRLFDIVPGQPDQSILLYRLQSADPGKMMPETGRAVMHQEGVELIRAWIAQLKGTCEI
jgi:uncharacterized repeat protein (TIGR03806 family)